MSRTPQGERLELVTDFSSLRAGDLVVLKDCDFCGATHRGILTVFNNDDGYGCNGEPNDEDGWELAPDPSCCGPGEAMDITWHSVAERILYRVIIPPPAKEQEVARPRVMPEKLGRVR